MTRLDRQEISERLRRQIMGALSYGRRTGLDSDFATPLTDFTGGELHTFELLLELAPDEATLARIAAAIAEVAQIPRVLRSQLLAHCRSLTPSPAAIELFIAGRDLAERLGEHLDRWVAAGLRIAERGDEAAHAYFALESRTAREELERLDLSVDFHSCERILNLYCEAFAHAPIPLRSNAELPPGHTGIDRSLALCDGFTLFLPETIRVHRERAVNFAAYKVTILHQLAFFAHGTFEFDLDLAAEILPSLRDWLGRRPQQSDSSSYRSLLNLFPRPDLADALFTLFEHDRIDHILLRQFRGLASTYRGLIATALEQRAPLSSLHGQAAGIEALTQLTLGAEATRLDQPETPLSRAWLDQAEVLVRAIERESATVYTTIEATIAGYELLHRLAVADLELPPGVNATRPLPNALDTSSLPNALELEADAADAGPVVFRGRLEPELVQRERRLSELARDRETDASAATGQPISEMLDMEALGAMTVQDGNLFASSGLLLEGLEGGASFTEQVPHELPILDQEEGADEGESGQRVARAARAAGKTKQVFVYDEWDYLIRDYRRGWCKLRELELDAGDLGLVDAALQRHGELLESVRRQFEMLRPEMLRRVRRLVDGEEIDLDHAIESLIDLEVGIPPSERIYNLRLRQDRDVAAAFLLDMSASTDSDVLDPAEDSPPNASATGQPEYVGVFEEDPLWIATSPLRPETPKRRVIDVEKEALLLMAESLETLGDRYAVFGFSGYGREEVDFFVAKEFEQPFDQRTQARIAAMEPCRSTRMGPAIRHALRKLDAEDARIKVLLILSDGYPQDFDYGRDRNDRQYGLQDTMMALREAQLRGVSPFCITVDPAGHDYLRQMLPEHLYLVIDEIAALPRELPKVYRGLTT